MGKVANKKRVLVTTVGPWSSQVGSDTMSALMSQYGAENVAAMYIRAAKSDSRSASRYFHIIEGRVMKSILHRGIPTGEELGREEINTDQTSDEENAETARYRNFSKHRLGIFIFAREFVWMLGKWKTPELDAFLEDFKPEVLICPIESYIHFNTINRYIICKCHPKVIGFLWDDNFTYKQAPCNFWHQLHRVWLRKSVRETVKLCQVVFCLSPKMKEECDSEFGIESQLLTKPIFCQDEFEPYKAGSPIKMLYTGNLFVGRDKTLMAIADALRVVNKNGVKAVLDIYTKSVLSDKEKAHVEIPNICRLHKQIPQHEVFSLQKEADVLLFAESLERKKNQGARLSFSTKITDYFRAGKCIWTVGSPTLGPVDYLMRMDASIVSTDQKSILGTLYQMIANPSIIEEYARKAFECGQRNHNGKKILCKLYKAVNS